MPVNDFKKFYHGYCIVSTRIIIHFMIYLIIQSGKLQIPSGFDNNVYQLKKSIAQVTSVGDLSDRTSNKSLIMNKIKIYCL